MSGIGAEFAVALLVGIIVCLFVYLPAFDCPYFADDFQYASIGDRSALAHFSAPYEHNSFYRPFQFAVMSLCQRVCGVHTWPLRLMHYLLHSVLAALVYAAVRGAGSSRLGAMMSLSFVLLAQGAAHAIASNDTFSQILSTTAGFGALLVTLRMVREGRGERGIAPLGSGFWRRLVLLALLWAACLWSKEGGVGLVVLSGLLLVAGGAVGRMRPERLGPAVTVLICIALGYWFARGNGSTVAIELGADRHQIVVGAVTLKNVAMMLAAALTPFSTTATYSAAIARDIPVLIAAGALSLAATGVGLSAVLGRARSSRLLSLGALVAALAACFPYALQNRVSELYSYNCLPFIAMMLGLGAAGTLRDRRPRFRRAAGAVLVAGILLANGLSAHLKSALVAVSGRTARTILTELVAYVQKLPDGALVLLVETRDSPSYSVFTMAPFELIGPSAERHVLEMAAREDVDLRWVSESEAESLTAQAGAGTYAIVAQGTDIVPFVAGPPSVRGPTGAAPRSSGI